MRVQVEVKKGKAKEMQIRGRWRKKNLTVRNKGSKGGNVRGREGSLVQEPFKRESK